MISHRLPWQKQWILRLASLWLIGQLANAQASTTAVLDPWGQRRTMVFSQDLLAPQNILLSQRLERRDGGKVRDKLRHKPDNSRRHAADAFERRAASVKQAAKMAQQQHGGKVLKVERNKQSYRVKMLRDGRVSYVQVPAQ